MGHRTPAAQSVGHFERVVQSGSSAEPALLRELFARDGAQRDVRGSTSAIPHVRSPRVDKADRSRLWQR